MPPADAMPPERALSVVKRLEYAPRYPELESDPNPFAVVVLAHLKALETRRSADLRREWKLRLAKGLYQRGMDQEDVRRLFDFIDWVMELPEPLEQSFKAEIEAFRRERQMRFMNVFERDAMVKGQLQGIEVLLKVKFGAEGLELMPELREIHDCVLLEKVLKRLETADSPAAVRRVWTRKRRPKPAEPM